MTSKSTAVGYPELKTYVLSADYRPQRYADICSHFSARGGDRKRIAEGLAKLRHEGILKLRRDHRFALAAVQEAPRHSRRSGALPETIEIPDTAVGILRFGFNDRPFIQPIGREFKQVVVLEGKVPKTEGVVVAVRILKNKKRSEDLHGQLEEVLGSLKDPAIDSKLVTRRADLPTDFPGDVRHAAEAISEPVLSEERGRRKDLTHLPFVTIDGADARDHDDAIALEKPNVVWVAIADVGHYVPVDSVLDREAAARANSFYFPDLVLPMLPERLSNDLCSLRPNQDRLVLAARLKVSADGRLTETELCEGIIHSRARLTYDGVDEDLKRKPRADLTGLRDLSEKLFKARVEDGAIDFDLSETKIVLDEKGEVKAMARRTRTPSQRIVEEMMLLANKGVAKLLSEAGWPLVYRIHDEPDDRKLADFFQLMREHGFPTPTKDLADTLAAFSGKAQSRIFSYLALRSMSQAVYSPKNIGHFGLGFPLYVHFTSPIRRYADLVVHRTVRKFLKREKPSDKDLFPKAYGTLDNLSFHITAQERLAMKTEREIRMLKGIRFLGKRIGQTFTGIIVGVIKHGLFVELDEHAVEGFVPARTLPIGRYEFRESDLSIRDRKGRVFRVGDTVTVKVAAVSLEEFKIDFALVERGTERRP